LKTFGHTRALHTHKRKPQTQMRLEKENSDVLCLHLFPAGGALLVSLDPVFHASLAKYVAAGNRCRRRHLFKADHTVELVVVLLRSGSWRINLLFFGSWRGVLCRNSRREEREKGKERGEPGNLSKENGSISHTKYLQGSAGGLRPCQVQNLIQKDPRLRFF